MEQHENHDQELAGGGPYAFFHDQHYGPPMPYTPTAHLPYQVMPNTQTADMLQMRQLSLMPHHPHAFQYPPSPTRTAAAMQLPPSPSSVDPTGTAIYEHPMSPPVSGSDASTDSQTPYHHNARFSRESSSGAGSPPARRSNQHRYNPTSGRRGRRGSRTDEQDLSDEGDNDPISPQSTGGLSGQVLAETLANTRKEATRRQRIEAEQRRRDELREGYARMKDVLPISNQKSSKVSLLERATNYITTLDQTNKSLQDRVQSLEDEVARLREMNERLSVTVVQTTGQLPPDLELGLSSQTAHAYDDPAHSGAQQVEGRPLSPPPDTQPEQHQQHHSHHSPHLLQLQASQQQPVEPQHEQQQVAGMYTHRNDSSASASRASGSEY